MVGKNLTLAVSTLLRNVQKLRYIENEDKTNATLMQHSHYYYKMLSEATQGRGMTSILINAECHNI